MKRFLRSLLMKYWLLLAIALVLIYLLTFIYMLGTSFERKGTPSQTDIEMQWRKEVTAAQVDDVPNLIAKWHATYPQASFFQVNQDGKLVQQWYGAEDLPMQWDAMTTTRFIQTHYGGDIFTILQFIGDQEANGFLVFQLERSFFAAKTMESAFFYYAVGAIVLFFGISTWFFMRTVRRLVNLEEAMTTREVDGLPIKTQVKNHDEIGAVEEAFNQMVDELRSAKQSEREEEQLRRELIANLSHDLKTPLTKMRAQLHYVAQPQAKQLDDAIDMMDTLLENLMDYSLLTANKMRFEPQLERVDRLVNRSVASWYPVFEDAGFIVELTLDKAEWLVDSLWLTRIIDNILQNVLRHASAGQYVSITVTREAIVVRDKGTEAQTTVTKGAGIGLTIVELMTSKMSLDFTLTTTTQGATATISHK